MNPRRKSRERPGVRPGYVTPPSSHHHSNRQGTSRGTGWGTWAIPSTVQHCIIKGSAHRYRTGYRMGYILRHKITKWESQHSNWEEFNSLTFGNLFPGSTQNRWGGLYSEITDTEPGMTAQILNPKQGSGPHRAHYFRVQYLCRYCIYMSKPL